jgi:hypothetical protein
MSAFTIQTAPLTRTTARVRGFHSDDWVEKAVNVRYWPKADMGCCTAYLRFRG